MREVPRRLSVAGAIALGALCLAVPAASADWTRGFDLSQPPDVGLTPSVGIDDAGRSVTAWEMSGEPSGIQLRARAANGTLGPITPVSAASGPDDSPQVAMNG